MRLLLFCCLVLMTAASCKKQNHSRVDIYLLKSFTTSIDLSTNPATTVITNAVLEDGPLVADSEIKTYTKATNTYKLSKDIQTLIKNYGPEKGFAVTVNDQPVYYGRFHPLYLSSITFGLATISPLLLNNDELSINFATVTGSSVLQQLDKRNDSRITNALEESGRLR